MNINGCWVCEICFRSTQSQSNSSQLSSKYQFTSSTLWPSAIHLKYLGAKLYSTPQERMYTLLLWFLHVDIGYINILWTIVQHFSTVTTATISLSVLSLSTHKCLVSLSTNLILVIWSSIHRRMLVILWTLLPCSICFYGYFTNCTYFHL